MIKHSMLLALQVLIAAFAAADNILSSGEKDLALQDRGDAVAPREPIIGTILAIIGLIQGTISLIEMNLLQFLKPSKPETTTIRYYVGSEQRECTPQTDDECYAGRRPTFVVFNHAGKRMGTHHGWWEEHGEHKWVHEGSFDELEVVHDAGHGQANWLFLSQSDSWQPICISGIVVEYADKQQYGWTGDIPTACGYPTYASYTKLNGKNDYRPRCVWLGQKNGGLHNAMSFEVGGFKGTEERAAYLEKNRDIVCNSPARFVMWTDGSPDNPVPYFSPQIEYDQNGTDIRRGRQAPQADWQPRDATLRRAMDQRIFRSPSKIPLDKREQEIDRSQGCLTHNYKKMQSSMFDGQLIKSKINHESHMASSLCADPSSVGPDFVSLVEMKFCDMSEKRLWDVCTEESQTKCFDLETEQMRQDEGKVSAVQVPKKIYHSSRVWTDDN